MPTPLIHIDKRANHNWAEVELFRWQYGHLPGEQPEDAERSVDVPVATRAMVAAIAKGCREQDRSIMPAPHNVMSVMEYLADLIEDRPLPTPRGAGKKQFRWKR